MASVYDDLVSSQLIERMHKIDLESDTRLDHQNGSGLPRASLRIQDESESGEKWQKHVNAFWKNCGDLEFLESPVVSNIPQTSNSLRLAEPGEPGPFARSNRFEILQTETTADVEDMNTLEEDEYDESDGESFEILPENSWMTADFSDVPDSNVDPEAVKVKVPPPIMETTLTMLVGFFFAVLEVDGIPTVHFGNWTLEALLDEGGVWDPSRPERRRLHAFWIEQARTEMQRNQQDEFDRLRERHAIEVQE
jgi:hypothetical protein